jgi:hypothetical protein
MFWGGVCLSVVLLLIVGLTPSSGRTSSLTAASTPPLSASIQISPSTPTAGSQFQISATVTGGVPPYSYVWSNTPSGCNPQPSPSWYCSVSEGGTYSVNLTVMDQNATQAKAFWSFTVNGKSGNNGNGSNGNSNGNGSNGFNLSSFGPLLFYGLIAGLIGFALLVALTVGVIAIAVILSRRLPRPPKGKLVCGSCQAKVPAGSKFCPACAAPIAPPKQG